MNSTPPQALDVAARHVRRSLQVLLLAAIVLVCVQGVLGMVVNLYVAVPAHHPGSHPSNYLIGSYDSVAWAVSHGAAALAVHASLGLALVVVAIGAGVHAIRAHCRAVAVWSVLGGLFVVGASFNGASFLDFADNISSLIMALLAFLAIASYAVALYLSAAHPE